MTMEASQRIPELTAWLAESDIALLELHGPGVELRLLRQAGHAPVNQTGEEDGTKAARDAQSRGNAVVRARCIRSLRETSLAARVGAAYWAVAAPHGPRSDL